MSRDQDSWLLFHHVPAGFVLCVGKQIPPDLGRHGSQVQEAGLGLQLPEQPQADKSQQILFQFFSSQGLQTTTSAQCHQRCLLRLAPVDSNSPPVRGHSLALKPSLVGIFPLMVIFYLD